MKKYVFADILAIGDESVDTRKDLAYESASPRELARLAEDPNSGVRVIVARNPSTPPEILAKLAEDPYVYVVAAVARNPNTPSDVLYSMFRNSTKFVQSYIALNPNCPEDLLKLLLDTKQLSILENLAENPNLPESLIRQMYADNVRFGLVLAENPNIPEDLKREIVDDLGLQSMFIFYVDDYDIDKVVSIVRSTLLKFGVEFRDYYDGYGRCSDGTIQLDFYSDWVSDDTLRSKIGSQIMSKLNAEGYSVDGWDYENDEGAY